MRRNLIFACFILMLSFATLAEDTIVETCANGAGTVVTGVVTGHKYCRSNKKMNWWNTNSWCDGLGMKLFDLSKDCACSDTVSNCANRSCAELDGAISTDQVWTVNVCSENGSYYYATKYGAGCNKNNRVDGQGGYALCK